MPKVVLLDPGLRDEEGNPSLNLGDLIISEAVRVELQELFPDSHIDAISSHAILGKKQVDQVKQSDYCFVGGTNLLSSDAMAFRGMPISDKKLIYLFPPVKNLILMGVGWGFGYGESVRFKTRLFYKKIFRSDVIHSCRDNYSASKFQQATSKQTLNTCCPSTWRLKNISNQRKTTSRECLFTLTDYAMDPGADNAMIKLLLEHFEKLWFFPQGSGDLEYIQTLSMYADNKSRIVVLSHDYEAFKQLANEPGLTYVGTRLHAGIKALESGMDAVIIAVDNRAEEIHHDTNLPVIKRSSGDKLQQWLKGEKLFGEFRLPVAAIDTWKKQFR